MLGKSRITKQLDYTDFIIDYLTKRGVGGGSRGHIWVSVLESYNQVVARGLG